MCLILDGIQLALSVGNAIYQERKSNTEKAIGEYQTNMLIKQAKKEEEKAKDEYQTGVEESRQAKLKSILRMGTNKAQIAGANIALTSSTALNLQQDEKYLGELESLNIFQQHKKNADAYLESSSNYYDKASLQSFKTKQQNKNKLFESLVLKNISK